MKGVVLAESPTKGFPYQWWHVGCIIFQLQWDSLDLSLFNISDLWRNGAPLWFGPCKRIVMQGWPGTLAMGYHCRHKNKRRCDPDACPTSKGRCVSLWGDQLLPISPGRFSLFQKTAGQGDNIKVLPSTPGALQWRGLVCEDLGCLCHFLLPCQPACIIWYLLRLSRMLSEM